MDIERASKRRRKQGIRLANPKLSNSLVSTCFSSLSSLRRKHPVSTTIFEKNCPTTCSRHIVAKATDNEVDLELQYAEGDDSEKGIEQVSRNAIEEASKCKTFTSDDDNIEGIDTEIYFEQDCESDKYEDICKNIDSISAHIREETNLPPQRSMIEKNRSLREEECAPCEKSQGVKTIPSQEYIQEKRIDRVIGIFPVRNEIIAVVKWENEPCSRFFLDAKEARRRSPEKWMDFLESLVSFETHDKQRGSN